MPIQQTVPGRTAVRTVTPRRVLAQAGKDRELQIPATMDGTNAVDSGQATGYTKYIRAGHLMAYSSGKWAPCKRTKANGSGSSATALVVDNTVAFQAGDSIIVGTNAAQAIVSVDSATGITLTSAISWADNDPVYVSAWGTARGVLVSPEEVICRNYDNTAAADQSCEIAVGGYFDQDKILGDLDAILENDKGSKIKYLSHLIFDDYQDGTDTEAMPLGPFGMRLAEIHGNKTLTAADNNTFFIVTAASTITLPTLAAGLVFGFFQEADANLIVAGPSSPDNIITFNDAAADSVAYSTSGEKIGAALMVFSDIAVTKWCHLQMCKNTLTVA